MAVTKYKQEDILHDLIQETGKMNLEISEIYSGRAN